MIINEKIQNTVIQNAVNLIWQEYGSNSQKEEACRVLYWCEKLLDKRGFLDENTRTLFVDLIYGAALVHNIWTFGITNGPLAHFEVFKARESFSSLLNEVDMPEDYRNPFFMLIEGQYGERSIYPQTHPNPDTPQSILADAKYIAEICNENGFIYPEFNIE